MDSILLYDALLLTPSTLRRTRSLAPPDFLPVTPSAAMRRPCRRANRCVRTPVAAAINAGLTANSTPPKNALYKVGDFMTKKENLHVVKPTTNVDEALERLVKYRISGFLVIDDDWKLVGVVYDYYFLASGSISGSGQSDTGLFPEVDSTWKAFNEIQKLLSKTNGKVISEEMTSAPLVVQETTNLEDAARLLLETKYWRLPVVDYAGIWLGSLQGELLLEQLFK